MLGAVGNGEEENLPGENSSSFPPSREVGMEGVLLSNESGEGGGVHIAALALRHRKTSCEPEEEEMSHGFPSTCK